MNLGLRLDRSGRIAAAIRPLFLFRGRGMAEPMRRFAPMPFAIAFAVLAACGPSESDPGPGGVTVGEAKALDEAAEMLEQRRPTPAPSADATVGEGAER